MSSITIKPNEKGTAIVTMTFMNEDGDAVVPKTKTWQLMLTDGSVINNRSFANGSFSGTEITLSGLDLAVHTAETRSVRIFAFQGTYDSDAGNDLPLHDEVRFAIERLVSQVDVTLAELTATT